MKLCSHALMAGIIPASWQEASIIVLPKDNKDKTNVESYRPISLLNFNHKIYTKAIATCLNAIIQEYISSDQTGFIPNRALTDNIQKSIGIIHHHCEKEKINFILLSVDIRKAFDSIEFTYRQTFVEELDFDPHFLSGFKAICDKPKACLNINGTYSTVILTRGMRKGCPLSPLLFAMAMKPLAKALRRHPQNTWSEFKLALCADDLTLYLTNPDCFMPQA